VLTAAYVGAQIVKGLWGIFRVANACGDPNAPNCPDTVVITSYTKQGGNITVTGRNTVDPKTGLFAPTVNICSGKVDTCPEGSASFLHKQPVDPTDGTWQFTGPKSPAPVQVTAVSAFGGVYTYQPFVKPPTPVKKPLKLNPEYKNSNTDRFEQKPLGKKPR